MSGRSDALPALPELAALPGSPEFAASSALAASPELAASTAPSALQIEFAAALLDSSRTSALMEKLARADDGLHRTPEASPYHDLTADSCNRADESVMDPSLSKLIDRVGLYRGNVHAHRRAALANAYPVLLSLVGDAYFDALSRAYGLAHPSQSGDLNRFGDALPAFIATYESDTKYTYFADMARLEWAAHQAHYAQDVKPFTTEEWARVGGGLLDERVAIHPACCAIESPFAIGDIWRAHQPGGIFPASIAAPSYALVVRPAWRATVLNQSEAAHCAFVALQGGRTLNEALDIAFAVDESFDFSRQWSVWTQALVVVGVRKKVVSTLPIATPERSSRT
ncbi:putative DNA-binding domain-containing protein [Pararobbsia alpina]|uniref:HvfC/BufC family peptide modification chaperone n=1 Tax=Pararobbsia alpina TaxID=621374 RepID=UPI0039A74E25